jgi:hypothetical protein
MSNYFFKKVNGVSLREVIDWYLYTLIWLLNACPWSTITNGREPKSCLGRVFKSKLGCIATLGSKRMEGIHPILKLKTWPWARPVS